MYRGHSYKAPCPSGLVCLVRSSSFATSFVFSTRMDVSLQHQLVFNRSDRPHGDTDNGKSTWPVPLWNLSIFRSGYNRDSNCCLKLSFKADREFFNRRCTNIALLFRRYRNDRLVALHGFSRAIIISYV